MLPDSSCWYHVNVLNNFFSSLLFIAFLILVRYYGEREMQKSHPHWTPEQRMRALGTARMIWSSLLLIGLFYLWSDAVYAFALSIFAIALACVTATKELIMCIHGYILLLQGHFYRPGDRIEVAGARGDVLDITLLTTTILEVGHGRHGHQKTGRLLFFANSILLNRFVYNESAFENFAMLTLSVPLHFTQDWQLAKAYLLESAQVECNSFLENAREVVKQIHQKQGIELPSVDPRVNVDLPNYEEVFLHLRVPCPLHMRETVEQAILTRFMEKMALARRKSLIAKN